MPYYCVGMRKGLASAVAMSRFGGWDAKELLTMITWMAAGNAFGDLTDAERQKMNTEGSAGISKIDPNFNAGTAVSAMGGGAGGVPIQCFAVSGTLHATSPLSFMCPGSPRCCIVPRYPDCPPLTTLSVMLLLPCCCSSPRLVPRMRWGAQVEEYDGPPPLTLLRPSDALPLM